MRGALRMQSLTTSSAAKAATEAEEAASWRSFPNGLTLLSLCVAARLIAHDASSRSAFLIEIVSVKNNKKCHLRYFCLLASNDAVTIAPLAQQAHPRVARPRMAFAR